MISMYRTGLGMHPDIAVETYGCWGTEAKYIGTITACLLLGHTTKLPKACSHHSPLKTERDPGLVRATLLSRVISGASY